MTRPISERKLQANRANAQRSTGPRTEAGKAISRRNALKHGILSRALDLPPIKPASDLHSSKFAEPIMSETLQSDSALREIQRIWDKMARILVFERDCMQRLGGLEQNGRVIHRYERMLTRELHRRICEHVDVAGKNRNSTGRK